MHPRSITARPWKMVVGRRSFPIGKVTFQGRTAKLPRGYCEFWSNIPWRFSSVTPWRTTAVRLQHRHSGAMWTRGYWMKYCCPETSSLTVWFCMTTSAKERDFWRKSCILLPIIFSLFCHSGRDFTRTNTTAVQVGRMSWLVVKTNTSSKKQRLFSVSNCLNCLVDRRLHGLKDTNGMALWGEVSVNQLSKNQDVLKSWILSSKLTSS